MLTFIPFRLYEGLWRYTGIWDLRNIVGGVALSTLAFYDGAHGASGSIDYPRSVFVVDALLLIFFIGGVRLLRRIHGEVSRLNREKRVLVYGAGDAGEMIVRDMRNTGLRVRADRASSTTTRRRSGGASTACGCSARGGHLAR